MSDTSSYPGYETPPGFGDFGVSGGFGAATPGPSFGATPVATPPAPRPKKARGRSTSSLRTLFLVILLALIAAIAVLAITAHKKTYVAEFNTALPAATPVTVSDLKAVSISSSKITTGAYQGSSASAALSAAVAGTKGKVVISAVSSGTQVTPDLLTTSSVSTGNLAAGSRLISVSAATATAVGGTIVPGDNVDVVAVFPNGTLVQAVAQDIPVVSVSPAGTSLAPPAPSSSGGSTTTTTTTTPTQASTKGVYVLSVPVADVLPLATADDAATLYLVLEGPNAQPLPTGSLTLAQALALAAS